MSRDLRGRVRYDRRSMFNRTCELSQEPQEVSMLKKLGHYCKTAIIIPSNVVFRCVYHSQVLNGGGIPRPEE